MPENKPGYMLSIEAYPHDEKLIALETMYYESIEAADAREHKTKRFLVQKDSAKMLAEGIMKILEAPDTQTAWESIANTLDESCDAELEGLQPDPEA